MYQYRICHDGSDYRPYYIEKSFIGLIWTRVSWDCFKSISEAEKYISNNLAKKGVVKYV